MMISSIISRLVILLFGNLYPAYASYKAVRTKNVKEYVKWMMYWIVFALFTCCETFTDVFLGFWFPFYYEIKIILVIWLLSPATKGSSFLYRKFVHPMLTKREPEIDEYLSRAKEQSYHTMLHLGTRGMTYATNMIMQTAIKGGGGIVNHLRRSYSLCDLSSNSDVLSDINRNNSRNNSLQPDDEFTTTDGTPAPNFVRDQRTTRSMRKAAAGNLVEMYFPEVDVNIRSHPSRESVPLGQIRSTDDISSGYSSADPVYASEVAGDGLMRTSSVGGARARARGGSTRAASKRGLTSEDSDLEDTDESSLSSSPTGSSWVPTNPTIPFYPMPFTPMCISSRPDEKIVFSTNLDVIQNQLALFKAFQEAQNFNINACNFSNFLFANDTNSFNNSEISNVYNLNDNQEVFKIKDISDKKNSEKLIEGIILNADEVKISKNKSQDKSNESAEEQSQVKEKDEFYDSITGINLLSPSVASSHDEPEICNLINKKEIVGKEIITTNLNNLSLFESAKNDCKVEADKFSDSFTDITSSNTDETNIKTEKTKVLSSSKRRYNKKRPAPLPPNVFKSDVHKENEEDDFLDAESDIISISERNDDESKDDAESNFFTAPDVISEIGALNVNENEYKLKETTSCDFDNNQELFKNILAVTDEKNDAVHISTSEEIMVTENQSDLKLFSYVGKSKSKSPSKISKFLPKTSNSIFGFLHSKETHGRNDNPYADSGSITETNDEKKEEKLISEKTSDCDKKIGDYFLIPLTEDKSDELKDEHVEIREMSQSPTAKRKHVI